MVKPNFIPRTLIGVGGVRLFNIPGVIYPEKMLKTNPRAMKQDGQSFNDVPPWGITTKAAALILGCSTSAARVKLHKLKVSYRIVCANHTRRIYWHKEQVEKIVSDSLPEMQGENRKLISTQEAIKLLGVSRSTLQRYALRGKLKAINVRYVMPDGNGTRHRTFFERAAILKLSYRLAAMRRHAEELDAMLAECDRRYDIEHGEEDK